MGYSDRQRHELEETIKRVPCDRGGGGNADRSGPRHQARQAERAGALRDRGNRQARDNPTCWRSSPQAAQASVGRGREVAWTRRISSRFATSRRSRSGTFFDQACQIKANPEAYADALKGKTLAMIFEKPSLAHSGDVRRRHRAAGRSLRCIFRRPRSASASASRCTTSPRTWSAWCRAS